MCFTTLQPVAGSSKFCSFLQTAKHFTIERMQIDEVYRSLSACRVRSGQFTNVLCHGQGWLRVSLPECCARQALLTIDVFIFTPGPSCLIQSMTALYIPLVTEWVTFSHWYFWICKGRSFQGTFSRICDDSGNDVW